MPSRRVLLAVAALGAVAPGASLSQAWAADAEANAVVSGLNQALLASMQAGSRMSFPQRAATLQPVIERSFDLPTILAAVVGPRWNGVPEDQKGRLLQAFRTFTVASYAANFDSFSGEKLEMLPDTRTVGADQVVATRIVPTGGASHRLDYVMRRGPAGWRIVDVLLDGSISQTAVQRSDFRSLLGSGGPDALVASLQQKIADLSGGTLR